MINPLKLVFSGLPFKLAKVRDIYSTQICHSDGIYQMTYNNIIYKFVFFKWHMYQMQVYSTNPSSVLMC